MPQREEMERYFSGVDSDVLDDLRWSGIVTYDWDSGMKIEDPVRMFAFIMKRAFPAESHSDE
jgi:hypothetical protein